MRVLILILVLVLTACGGSPPVPTAQGVVDGLKASGIELTDVAPGVREPDALIPNSFREWLTFTIAEVAPKGGQVFVCDTKPNCDALYAHFDMFRGLVGPYLYQSKSGLVVVQMNSGLSPDIGEKAAATIAEL